MERCCDCRFWQKMEEAGVRGRCHMRAPAMAGTIAPHGNSLFQEPDAAVWPITYPDDWCGDGLRMDGPMPATRLMAEA